MSLRVEYICDLCRDVKQKTEIIAVVFKSFNGPFDFIACGNAGFLDHQGRHLCVKCIKHIRQLDFNDKHIE